MHARRSTSGPVRLLLMCAWLTLFGVALEGSVHAQNWTPFTSEEQGENSPALCSTGLVSGLRCSGRYCDNVSLACAVAGVATAGTWGPYFSEEAPAEQICPDGEFVSGLRCKGRYCDDMSLRCTRVPALVPERCYWTSEVSEENGGTLQYGQGTYLRGLRCGGRYCDNLRSYVCDAAPFDCSSAACKAEQAHRFAPLLRFDQEQGNANKCLPSDAGAYYQARKSGSAERICNTDVASIERGQVPIYYEVQDCSPDTTVIMYWFFYGYQDTCSPGLGDHPADWERVAVKLKNGTLERVLYFQHSGHYTRQGQDLQYFEGTHPVAYVGKNSHGSYHDSGGSGSCLYFEDFRNPGSRNLSMRTWSHLVELHAGMGAPEWMRTKSSQYFDGIPAPLARDIDICALPGCKGDDVIIGSAFCFGQCGCAKSSIGSAPF